MSADAPGRSALITGGAGFIGSHLSELLLEQGTEVFVLDGRSTGSERNVAHLRERRDFHLIVDSVLKSSVVNELVHRCDVVYHLAAAVGVRLIVEEPVHTLVTNIQGTENVLDHCNRFGKRVLVASTSEVYGDRREPEALSEESKRMYGPTTARRWAYADSKAMDEFLALAYHQERGLDCVIVRLFNTVGPRQSGEYGMVVPRFVQAALSGRPLEIHGDGTQSRCFCHISDTIRALTGLAEERSTNGEIYNVGSTESIGILDLAHRGRLAPDGLAYLRLPARRRAALAREAGLELGPGLLDVGGRLVPAERAALRWALGSGAASTRGRLAGLAPTRVLELAAPAAIA